MYKIKRNRKSLPKVLRNTFDSYDKARQAIRKWIMSQVMKSRMPRYGMDARNRTITIGHYGFGVRPA